MIPLPSVLQHACHNIAKTLTQEPLVCPTPHQRRQLYAACEGLRSAQRMRSWMAVFVAQRALPIFQSRFPDDNLPAQLIDTALHVLHAPDSVNTQMVEEMSEWGYNAAGHCWGYEEEELPLYIDYAGQAAYHALGSTTHGLYFLQDLDTGYGTMTANGVHIITGDEWTNQRLLHFSPAVDSALYAAVALATDPTTEKCEPQRWYQYWTWWLSEAIPMAWEEVAHD